MPACFLHFLCLPYFHKKRTFNFCLFILTGVLTSFWVFLFFRGCITITACKKVERCYAMEASQSSGWRHRPSSPHSPATLPSYVILGKLSPLCFLCEMDSCLIGLLWELNEMFHWYLEECLTQIMSTVVYYYSFGYYLHLRVLSGTEEGPDSHS